MFNLFFHTIDYTTLHHWWFNLGKCWKNHILCKINSISKVYFPWLNAKWRCVQPSRDKNNFSMSKNIGKDTKIKCLAQKMRKMCFELVSIEKCLFPRHNFLIFWPRDLILVSFSMFLDLLNLVLPLRVLNTASFGI